MAYLQIHPFAKVKARIPYDQSTVTEHVWVSADTPFLGDPTTF